MKNKILMVSYIDKDVRHLGIFDCVGTIQSLCGEQRIFTPNTVDSSVYTLDSFIRDNFWKTVLCHKCVKKLPENKKKEVIHSMITYKLKCK